ncbi:MAG: metallophosphoesterase [Cyanobacteria bacterium P01_D01_bin.128]
MLKSFKLLTLNWRRLSLACLGLILSLSLACTQSGPQPDSAAQPPAAAAPTETADTPADIPVASAPLPPETQAIVDNVGPESLVNPPRGDVRLVVISDLNGPYGSIDYDPEIDTAITLLPFWQPDMVVCSGDMVAGQDLTLTEQRMREMWAGFDQHVGARLRDMGIPYGFTVGNHDASGARGVGGTFLFQKERDIAEEYWRDPAHDPGIEFVDRNDFPFYYTFERDGIFFLAWDGSSDTIPPENLAWVEQALGSPAAQQAKMRILLGHLPLYPVAEGRNTPAEVMSNADQLQAMLEKYDVHTYISGHHHAYYPAHRGNLQLLHTGVLGAGPRPLIDSSLPPAKALTIVDISFDTPSLTAYTTYNMQTLQVIEMQTLPRILVGHNGMVLRRDIDWEDLAADEKALCEQRLGAEKCLS